MGLTMVLRVTAPQHRCCTSGISSGSEQHLWSSRCRPGTSRAPHSGPQTAALPFGASPTCSGAVGTQRQPARSAVCSSTPQHRLCSSRSGPRQSCRRAVMAAAAAQTGSNGGSAAAGASGQDLLVVGPGVLGSYVGRLWLEAFPDSTVVGQTNTTSSHDRCLHEATRYCAAPRPCAELFIGIMRCRVSCCQDVLTARRLRSLVSAIWHKLLVSCGFSALRAGCGSWACSRAPKRRRTGGSSRSCCSRRHPPAARTTPRRCRTPPLLLSILGLAAQRQPACGISNGSHVSMRFHLLQAPERHQPAAMSQTVLRSGRCSGT